MADNKYFQLLQDTVGSQSGIDRFDRLIDIPAPASSSVEGATGGHSPGRISDREQAILNEILFRGRCYERGLRAMRKEVTELQLALSRAQRVFVAMGRMAARAPDTFDRHTEHFRRH